MDGVGRVQVKGGWCGAGAVKRWMLWGGCS